MEDDFLKLPPGVAVSWRKAPGSGPRERTRLDDDVAWIKARQRAPMHDDGRGYNPYARPQQEICGSCLPPIRQK
jgi:hypothetical protein